MHLKTMNASSMVSSQVSALRSYGHFVRRRDGILRSDDHPSKEIRAAYSEEPYRLVPSSDRSVQQIAEEIRLFTLFYGGIDTHADTHHVAVIDATRQRLADVRVPATAAGYQAALRFLGTWPALVSVSIECAGS